MILNVAKYGACSLFLEKAELLLSLFGGFCVLRAGGNLSKKMRKLDKTSEKAVVVRVDPRAFIRSSIFLNI